MSNRKRDEARAIESSRGYSDESRSGPRENSGGWRSDLDEELRRFFSGDFVGEAGLRSKVGSQLDKIRDGVNYGGGGGGMTFLGADSHGPAIWCRSDLPARCVEFGRSGLGVNRVMNALRAMPEVAVRELVADKRKKLNRDPTADEARAVVERAARHVAILAEFYTPVPSGTRWGFLGLGDVALVAATTSVVVKATKASMADECEKELNQARSAMTLSAKEAAERLDVWEEALSGYEKEAEEAAAELESHADESGEVSVVNIARRRQMLRRLEYARAQAATVAAHVKRIRSEQLPAIDVEGMVRRKWEREPTRDELRDMLRRMCDEAKRLKTPELRAEAQRLVNDAQASAKRDLAAARAAYAAARGPARSKREDRTIAEFEERVGIR
jgi:hypothetical protein